MQRSELSDFFCFLRRRTAQKFYATRRPAGATPRRALPPRKTAPYPAFLQLNVSYVKYLGANARPPGGGTTGSIPGGSGAQQLPGLDAARGQEVDRREFFTLPELGAQHFDAAALGGHLKARRAAFDDFADLALDGAESANRQLPAVKYLELHAVQRGPCARSGVAAANQVVDHVNLVRP